MTYFSKAESAEPKNAMEMGGEGFVYADERMAPRRFMVYYARGQASPTPLCYVMDEDRYGDTYPTPEAVTAWLQSVRVGGTEPSLRLNNMIRCLVFRRQGVHFLRISFHPGCNFDMPRDEAGFQHLEGFIERVCRFHAYPNW